MKEFSLRKVNLPNKGASNLKVTNLKMWNVGKLQGHEHDLGQTTYGVYFEYWFQC